MPVAVRPDGSQVFVTGESSGNGGYTYDYATIAYDAATGTKLWTQRYPGSPDGAHAIAVSPDGSQLFVTGSGFVTIAYSTG